MREVKELRKLSIKTFHVEKVEFSDKTFLKEGTLYLRHGINNLEFNKEYIKGLKIRLIEPSDRKVFVNSIMDFSPIATKVLGSLGEGITHVFTGITVMLTGIDEEGIQVAEFGSSEGILEEQVVFDRAGTPKKDDIIIHLDFVLKKGMGTLRSAITEVHKVADTIIQEIRGFLKNLNGKLCDERYEYYDTVKKHRKNIVIVKQVAGQGAMYDTALFGKEPCGALGSRSIIDMGNVPVILSPNEYRDGALRAMH
ncbi:proline reductase cluster protein PrdD [Clostridium hydrogeniformans]|uniref:proline reductase cluster protein PrdD n=1 Tax=Clostridium hydrogeniformans TaxID=349933 RepID=UPI0004823F86|nr:proline reductase cluster protein PrdD [Clostridium hydrogeniformans]